ncbi:MAG: hypothetical protein Q8T08_06745, partial [Ignavibacteria bacterium]|nr:hypothetical protein [Ignavibacteria bacterium]
MVKERTHQRQGIALVEVYQNSNFLYQYLKRNNMESNRKKSDVEKRQVDELVKTVISAEERAKLTP